MAPARRAEPPMPGSDYEAVVHLTFEQALHGTEVDLGCPPREWDPDGGVRVPIARALYARIPRGVTNNESSASPARRQGRERRADGDLAYLDIEVADHPLYRVSGHDPTSTFRSRH